MKYEQHHQFCRSHHPGDISHTSRSSRQRVQAAQVHESGRQLVVRRAHRRAISNGQNWRAIGAHQRGRAGGVADIDNIRRWHAMSDALPANTVDIIER